VPAARACARKSFASRTASPVQAKCQQRSDGGGQRVAGATEGGIDPVDAFVLRGAAPATPPSKKLIDDAPVSLAAAVRNTARAPHCRTAAHILAVPAAPRCFRVLEQARSSGAQARATACNARAWQQSARHARTCVASSSALFSSAPSSSLASGSDYPRSAGGVRPTDRKR